MSERKRKAWATASGREIDEGRARELAEQFESEESVPPDAVVTFPRRAGRPSLGHGATSPQVSFRLPRELRDEAERRAEAEGTTVSALARRALEELLRHSA